MLEELLYTKYEKNKIFSLISFIDYPISFN